MRGGDEQTGALTGTAERNAAIVLVDRMVLGHRITLGADKGYDVAGLIAALRARRGMTPVAVGGRSSKLGKRRNSGVEGRTKRHAGYSASQRVRKWIEEVSGWIKVPAGLRQTEHGGRERVGWQSDLASDAYNLIRPPRLLSGAAA